jgi:predicted metal-binding membrane protein
MPRREAAVAALSTPPAAPQSRGLVLLSAGTIAILALSWGYLLYMDWGMRHMDRGADMLLMPRMIGWQAIDLFLVFVMWALMMAAMMLPSAWPAIRLYGHARGTPVGFAAGYLLVWFGFSALATLLQWRLLEAALLTPMMKSASVPLSAGVLIGAGLFQLTPLKQACLSRCRSPLAAVLAGSARSASGIREGISNGLDCLGCCFALMCVLFAVGVMSIPWVLAIAAYVGLEKLVPRARWVPRLAGVALCAWGVVLLVAC